MINSKFVVFAMIVVFGFATSCRSKKPIPQKSPDNSKPNDQTLSEEDLAHVQDLIFWDGTTFLGDSRWELRRQ